MTKKNNEPPGGFNNDTDNTPRVTIRIEYKKNKTTGARTPHFYITGLNKVHADESVKKELREIYQRYLTIANENNGVISKDTVAIFERHIELWLREKIEEGSIINVEE